MLLKWTQSNEWKMEASGIVFRMYLLAMMKKNLAAAPLVKMWI